MTNVSRVVVIGAGPAGILAAGSAASAGAAVRLIEKKSRPGNKLLITGKGRCNLTNAADIDVFVTAFGKNGRFLYRAFSTFFRDELLSLLLDRGVHTIVERGGRIFPESGCAADVLRALLEWATDLGVEIRTGTRAIGFLKKDGLLSGVKITGGSLEADAIIIATGGLSYSGTGSTGDGYTMAQEAGHAIVQPRPALVPLIACDQSIGDLEGLSLRHVKASLLSEDTLLTSEEGEMLFTSDGVSGPIILTLSGTAAKVLGTGKECSIVLDMKPYLTRDKLSNQLKSELRGKGILEVYLRSLLPRRLIGYLLRYCSLEGRASVSAVTAEERERILSAIKGLHIALRSPRPIEEAIITSGGVDIRQIDPLTMQSKLLPGLYFAGEIIDVDGPTGGYNLQAAFSTGWLAGSSAAS